MIIPIDDKYSKLGVDVTKRAGTIYGVCSCGHDRYHLLEDFELSAVGTECGECRLVIPFIPKILHEDNPRLECNEGAL